MPATLHVIFGPIGAGKTTYAHALARREGAVPFVLDEWGARLFGPDVNGALDFGWMVERRGRCHAPPPPAGAWVARRVGARRGADGEGTRRNAEAAGHRPQWHFVDAPQEV